MENNKDLEKLRQEQINEFVESVNISQVLDSACDGAIDDIFRQLKIEGCPEEILQEVSTIINMKITIDKNRI